MNFAEVTVIKVGNITGLVDVEVRFPDGAIRPHPSLGLNHTIEIDSGADTPYRIRVIDRSRTNGWAELLVER